MATHVVEPRSLIEGSRKNLAALLALHEELSSQRGGVVVLGGPRGVGKAMLLSELRRDLTARGRIVLFGRAEQTATHPYAALREPAAQALALLEARGVAEQFLDAHARALGVLLPGLSAPTPANRAKDKSGFFEALRAFVIDLSRFGAVTLLVADLHYADDDTRDAVKFLAQHLFDVDDLHAQSGEGEGFAGVLMAAVRTDDDDGMQFAKQLVQGRRGRLYDVQGLSRDGLVAYLAQHPLLEKLLAASRGRAEDVDELLEALPKDTAQLLLAKVAALEPAQRRAVCALAVLGRPAPPDLVAAILGVPGPATAQAMAALVESRLLARRLQNGELLFTFARPHHQEMLALHLGDDERRALHAAIAVALEARSVGGDEQLLAFHFLRGSDPARGVPYALAACEKLLLTFAYGTAVDLAARALVHATQEQRFALLGHVVEAQRLRGELGLALSAAEEMRALARRQQLPQVLRRIGELLGERGEHREALEVLEEGARVHSDADGGVDDALPERALLLAAMAEVSYQKGDHERAQATAKDALRAAPHAPVAFKLRISNTLGKVDYSHERYAEAEARFLDNLRMAEDNGLLHEAVLARINTGLARHRQGRDEEAREILERALQAARAAGDIDNEAHALLNLGAIAQRQSELGRSLVSYRAGLALFARLGNRAEVRRATWNLANLYAAIGQRDAAHQYLEQSRRIAELDDSERGRAFVCFTEGDLAFDEGRSAEALTAYEKARAIFAALGETSRVVEMTVKAAWAALHLGDVALAKQRVDELPDGEPGALAKARRDAVMGAVLSFGDRAGVGVDDGARGLPLLSRAIDELERLKADEDAWRTLSFLADRFESRGDGRSAEAARARARSFVLRCADRLPGDLREHYLADPSRAALLGLPPKRPETSPYAEAAKVADPLREALAPRPARPAMAPLGGGARRPEWDEKYKDIIGRSPTLTRVFDRLDRIARSKQATVLIRGESGTGKELVAASVHRSSDRAHGPFVRVNCAALVETLLLSELFGHEKGSFTGALARKVGRFELARGGTIFLDEIGDISPKTQVSLLRVLQERTFERVGGTQTITTDAAVICATHRDLEAMVGEGTFREDLYYRLKGVVVEVPALRERPEDIPFLVEHFLAKAKDELGRSPIRLSREAADILVGYRWPGNIRELQNVVRSVALFCEGEVVEPHHLAEFPELFAAEPQTARPTHASHAAGVHAPPPAHTVHRTNGHGEPPPAAALPRPPPQVVPPEALGVARDVLRRVEDGDGIALGDLKRQIEFEAIANAMRQTGGNITRAAAMLKMKRPRLSQIVNGNPELKAIKEASRDPD